MSQKTVANPPGESSLLDALEEVEVDLPVLLIETNDTPTGKRVIRKEEPIRPFLDAECFGDGFESAESLASPPKALDSQKADTD